MATYKIAVLPGDGIGSEIINEAVKVLNAIQEIYGSLKFETEFFDAGAEGFLKTGMAMPEGVFDHCQAADAVLMGAIGLPEARHPDGTEVGGDVIFRLRFDLDLYAGVRPVKLFPGVPSPLRDVSKGIDYVIVRENIEGLYASRVGGCNVRGEVATDTLIITRTGTRKVTNYAFKLAQRRKGRPLDGKSFVTCVDKSNVLRSYAFFRSVYDEVAAGYSEIGRDYAYVDAMTVYQVLNPYNFDVVVAENMFGDIISDLSGATVGGLGMAPSGDIGDNYGMFQPSHGSAPTIAGKNLANPLATILSTSMMLDWLGERNGDSQAIEASKKVEAAVASVLKEGKFLTVDLGGRAGTSQIGNAIVTALKYGTK